MRATSGSGTRALVTVATVSALHVSGLSGQASSADPKPNGPGQGAAHIRSHGPDSTALDRQDLVAAPFAADTEVPWSTADYDGVAYTDDRPDVAGRVGLPMVHAISVHPRDRSSRFPKLPWWTVSLSRYVCPPGGDCSKPNTPEY